MKEKILLDTNMMIYILDDHVLDEQISKLTKILYDSDKYMIAIHPKTLEEANKIKKGEFKLESEKKEENLNQPVEGEPVEENKKEKKSKASK